MLGLREKVGLRLKVGLMLNVGLMVGLGLKVGEMVDVEVGVGSVCTTEALLGAISLVATVASMRVEPIQPYTEFT